MMQMMLSFMGLIVLQSVFSLFVYLLCAKEADVCGKIYRGFLLLLVSCGVARIVSVRCVGSVETFGKILFLLTLIVAVADVVLFCFRLFRKKEREKAVGVKINARQVFGIILFCILILLQISVYVFYVPMDGARSMAEVGAMLKGNIAGEGLVRQMMALTVKLAGCKIGEAVCVIVPIWLLCNLYLLAVSMAARLFSKESRNRILFLDLFALCVLLADYDKRSVSAYVLHGLNLDRGVFYVLILSGLIWLFVGKRRGKDIVFGVIDALLIVGSGLFLYRQAYLYLGFAAVAAGAYGLMILIDRICRPKKEGRIC